MDRNEFNNNEYNDKHMLKRYFEKDGIEKVAFHYIVLFPSYFIKVLKKRKEDGCFSFYQNEYDKLIEKTANEYYELEFIPKIISQRKGNGFYRFSEKDIDKITKEKYIPLMKNELNGKYELIIKNYVNIISNDKKPITKEGIYHERVEYCEKHKKSIPTMRAGLLVLFFVMGISSILYERIGFWIIEICVFLWWRSKEIKKYHPHQDLNPEKDPFFLSHITKEDWDSANERTWK